MTKDGSQGAALTAQSVDKTSVINTTVGGCVDVTIIHGIGCALQ